MTNKIRLLVVLFSISVSALAQQRFGDLLKDTPGLVSYTFRNEFAKDVPGTLDAIKSMGFTNMEFSNL